MIMKKGTANGRSLSVLSTILRVGATLAVAHNLTGMSCRYVLPSIKSVISIEWNTMIASGNHTTAHVEPRDLRTFERFQFQSVRRSFDSLSLAQDDRSGEAARFIYCSNIDKLRATARVAPTRSIAKKNGPEAVLSYARSYRHIS